jgi:hypothetical protein
MNQRDYFDDAVGLFALCAVFLMLYMLVRLATL